MTRALEAYLEIEMCTRTPPDPVKRKGVRDAGPVTGRDLCAADECPPMVEKLKIREETGIAPTSHESNPGRPSLLARRHHRHRHQPDEADDPAGDVRTASHFPQSRPSHRLV